MIEHLPTLCKILSTALKCGERAMGWGGEGSRKVRREGALSSWVRQVALLYWEIA